MFDVVTTFFVAPGDHADRGRKRAGSGRRARTAFASSGHHQAQHHDVKLNQVNLASDIPGKAPLTDPDLKNPWGISHSPTSPLWVSNQGTNSSTLYTLTPGSGTVTKVPTVRVTMAGSVAGPTGQVNNTGTGFVLSNGP